jgi:SAM-dependent methyltransferase
MSPFAKDYAKIYDSLYKEKDYKHEVDKVRKFIKQYKPGAKTILDYGCGTGNHAGLLASGGYRVCGIDRNAHMLDIAKRKNKAGVCFCHSDKRDSVKESSVDVCISLFDVISYMHTNEEINNFLSYVKRVLVNKGLLILDFWYGPGVVSMGPEKRWKEFSCGDDKIIRFTSPELDTYNSAVNVTHDVLFFRKNLLKDKLTEVHRMRYFSRNEILLFLSYHGFEVLKFGTWKDINTAPGLFDWSALTVSKLHK